MTSISSAWGITVRTNFSLISERLANCFGDKIALYNIERDRSYTFRQFHELTNKITNMMRHKLELSKGHRWLTILENDNLSILHYFTAMKGDATGCFTNYRDDFEVHAQQIDLLKPKVVFLESELLSRYYQMLRERGIVAVTMDRIEEERPGLHYFWDLLEGVSDANPNIISDERTDPKVIRFTGGTTGNSKAAMYSIQNWIDTKHSFYSLEDASWGGDDRTLHLTPMSHGSGMLFLPTLFKGGTTYTMNKPDLADWCRNVEQFEISKTFLVPTVLYRLLEMPEAKQSNLSSLETIFYGAAPMSASKLHRLLDRFGSVFTQIYASTEHPGLAVSMSRDDHRMIDGSLEHLSAAGKAVPGLELTIVDDDGEPVKFGEAGEIWIRSSTTILGYFENPEGTAKEFSDGYWKSGDIARMDEKGYIYIVDRKKDMIISGGFNVYCSEVEGAINTHESVFMSAVIGVPHKEWGEAVHAEIILREGGQVSEEELIKFVRLQLGGYKTPKTINIVKELPLNAVGKVLRREVRKRFWQAQDRNVG